jgi:hypothetical protein
MKAWDFFGLEGLTDLGSRNGVDMRPTLLRVLTDLYVHRLSHTAAEERHFAELALRLLEAVNVPTRVAVAKRLARHTSPPLKVLQWLARDLPEVAAEIRLHPRLQPSALADGVVANATAMPIAKGDAADEEQRSADTARAVDVVTASKLNDLFFAAKADERRLILLNLHVVAPVAPGRVRMSRDPSVGQLLEVAALARKREDFVQHLARALRVPRQQARRIADDDLGEPVVVAGKALGMSRHVLYRILMFVNPAVGHSVERVHALAALFDEMTPPAAEGMVAIWQALAQNDRAIAKYRPLAWDDEARRRARPGTAVQRSPLTVQTSERRSVS